MTKFSSGDLAHRARKRFGQNFLVDHAVLDRIARAVHPAPGQHLVEIGPGKGALTELLVQEAGRLSVIELDRDLVPWLKIRFERYEGFELFQADALKFDFSALAQADTPLRIVGNLPYNISTPLIFHLLRSAHLVQDMHFMLQKEVVQRLAAQPEDKAYGRLGIMVQYYCQVENLFEVPPRASWSCTPRRARNKRRLGFCRGLPTQSTAVETTKLSSVTGRHCAVKRPLVTCTLWILVVFGVARSRLCVWKMSACFTAAVSEP